MESTQEIPESWETEEVEVVTVNPHTGELVDGLSSSGAGPQTQEIRGTILSKPCGNCDDGEMEYMAPNASLICDRCGAVEDYRIHKNKTA